MSNAVFNNIRAELRAAKRSLLKNAINGDSEKRMSYAALRVLGEMELHRMLFGVEKYSEECAAKRFLHIYNRLEKISKETK